VEDLGRPSEVQVVGKNDEGEQPVVVHRPTITYSDRCSQMTSFA
jgi:hypothetical protein